jgi:tetratricopeptide (TPR) repeat protein
MLMGRALRDKNLFINSLVHFKELSRYLPDSDEVHYELARTYQLQGDMPSAYREYQQVLKLNPRHKQAKMGLSDVKMKRR